MDEIWLYHYDTDTKQQSMEWRHSGSPGPKIKSERKNSGGKYLASNFWDREGILNFIIFLRAKLTTRSVPTSPGTIDGYFEEKRRLSSARCPVLARQFPASPGKCNPEETGLTHLPVT